MEVRPPQDAAIRYDQTFIQNMQRSDSPADHMGRLLDSRKRSITRLLNLIQKPTQDGGQPKIYSNPTVLAINYVDFHKVCAREPLTKHLRLQNLFEISTQDHP